MEPLMEQQDQGQTETDRLVGEMILYAVLGILMILFFVPALIGMPFFGLIQMLRRPWLHYVGLVAGIVLVGIELLNGHLLSYFGLLSELNIPIVSDGVEYLLNNGKVIATTSHSYIVMVGLALVTSFGYSVYFKYFWKKRVSTRADETRKKKEELAYEKFRHHRLKFLNKKQLEYRSKPNDSVFVGYTAYKDRVEIALKEFNYHALFVGGTGTGKTTLIATILEAASVNNEPIIFMDGKGELKSMYEFKELFEGKGKKVYMFTELNDLTYNPVKHGSATEVRDKVMSLFTFSTEGDGAYYTDIASRYVQLIVKLIDRAGLPRDLKTITELTNMKRLSQFFQDQKRDETIIDYVDEVVTVDLPTGEDEEDPEPEKEPEQHDLLADMMGEVPAEAPKQKRLRRKTEKVETTIKVKRERTVSVLEDGLQEIKQILDEEFPEEIIEGCLTRLRMQLGELLESDLGHLFVDRPDGIDLRKIAEEGNAVIFSISGSKYSDYIKRIGKMIILDVNSLVAHQQATGRKDVFAVYDEISAYMDARLVDLVNKSRSAGMRCILSTQTLSDIDAVDPVLTEQIISNVNIIATGRVNSAIDAERLSNIFGTYHDQEITQQIEKKNNMRKYEANMGTIREVEKFKVHPNDIKNLQMGEVYLVRKMTEDGIGETYTRHIYVRNALDLGGIA